MSRIEVTLLNPFRSDGWKSIERYGRLLSRMNLAGENVSVTVYTPREFLKSFGEFAARRMFYPIAIFKFRRAKLVHILDAAYSNLLIFLPTERTVVTCHDTEIWRTLNFFNRFVRYRLLRHLSRCATVVTPSNVVAAQLKALFVSRKLNAPPIKVIANAVDPVFRPESARVVLRPTLEKSGDPAILYIANTSWPRKNFPFLLAVLSHLKQGNFLFKLTHLGPSLTRDQISELSRLGLAPNWKTVSDIGDAEVAQLYHAADLVLIPSQYEGFGYPLIEASACRTAFFASDIPTFRELIPEGYALLPLDSELWANEVQRFFKDQLFRSGLLKQTNSLESKFSLETHLKEYESLYASIVQAADCV